MPASNTQEITPKSIRDGEAALTRAFAKREADRVRAEASEAAFRQQCLIATQQGVMWSTICEVTGLSMSRIDQILRAERQK